MKNSRDTLSIIASEIVSCERCPRLRRHCEEVGRIKRRAYREQDIAWQAHPLPEQGRAVEGAAVAGDDCVHNRPIRINDVFMTSHIGILAGIVFNCRKLSMLE